MTRTLEHIADGDWNSVRRNFEQTDQRLTPPVPQARVYNSANISIANNANAQLTFDSEHWDNGDLHSTATNTGRLTAPIAGLYQIGACVEFATNATGTRLVSLLLNGSSLIAAQFVPPITGFATILTVDTEFQLAAGDVVEVRVFQNSGGALNVNRTANYSPEFWMHRVSGYTNAGVG